MTDYCENGKPKDCRYCYYYGRHGCMLKVCYYGMIDGIINNGPKEQPETKPKAPDLSALFEAARQVVQEDKQVSEPGKKPSVLAMLHAPAPSRSEKTAQTKSAERDLI